MSTLYRHRIWCLTEGAWVFLWKETSDPLERCPNDPAHEIQPGSASIEGTLTSNDVHIIAEREMKTGGHLGFDHIVLEAPAEETAFVVKSWDFPASLYGLRLATPESSVGCLFTADISVQNAATSLTADARAGDTVLHVDSKGLGAFQLGMLVSLSQGALAGEAGRLVEIDADAGTVSTSAPLGVDFLLEAGEVTVTASERICDSLELAFAGTLSIGRDRFIAVPFEPKRALTLALRNPNPASARLVVYISYAY